MLGGVALACVASGAEAAGARLRFSIPPGSYADALVDLGLQANVSVLGTTACGSSGRTSLNGRYTVDEALARLLSGAPCRYQIVDTHTVRILAGAPAPPPPAREAPRPPSLVAEVVVTATKRPVALDRLPAGVSAISRDQIDATRAIDVGQTVGQLAGVLTTNLGPGRDKLLIRGLSDGAFTGRTRSTVGTYLDDAPINYNAPDPDLRLVDVDRVEVVRGPQGALYGSGAIAGIYRIVTTKPDLQQMEFGGSASIAQTRGGDASHEFDGYLSVPLIADHLGIRLVAYDEVQGGYLDDVALGAANVDQTHRDGGRLAVRVRFDDNWRLDAQAATQHLRSNDTQYVRDDMGSSVGPQRRSRIRETHNNDFSYGGATLHGEFDWGSVTSSLNYVHHVFSSQFDASEALGDLEIDKISDLGAYVEATRSNMLVQDLVVRSSGRGPFEWLVGAYAAKTVEKTPSSLSLLASRTVSTVYVEERKDRLTEYALYGEGSYDFGGGWSITLGGRLFQSRVHTTAELDVVLPYGPRSFDQARTFDGFSPKISLQREFSNGDLIYGLISEGYRPGGFNSSGFFAIAQPRATFAQDRLRNYEVGVKLRRFDGRLGVRAAAYYDDWENIQTDQYRQSGLAFTGNVGDARIMGLEAELGYEWPFGLSVQLNGLLSDSEIRNPNIPTFAFAVSKELPGVPKLSGGALVVYQRPIGSRYTLRLVGEANYVGSTGLNFDTYIRDQPRTDGYLRAKLSAEVANDHWRLAVFVNNPFDDEGDTFAYGNPFSFSRAGVRQATPQRPRTVGVRLGATF